MSDITDLYTVLECMERNAEKDNVEEVLELNKQYEEIVHDVYHGPQTSLEIQYEQCRQSCVLPFMDLMPFMHDELIEDAKESFAKIPRPYDD